MGIHIHSVISVNSTTCTTLTITLKHFIECKEAVMTSHWFLDVFDWS